MCGDVVTNATALLPCLGYKGTADVHFDIEATVIWCGSDIYTTRAYYVKAYDGYIRFEDRALWPDKALSTGDIVRLRGKTAERNRYFLAKAFTIDILGHADPEPPVDSTIDNVLAGRHYFRPVRIRGCVQDVFADEIDHRYKHIVISSGGKSIGLSIPTSEDASNAIPGLVGATVRATGVYLPFFEGFRRLCKSEIHISSAKDLEIVLPPPQDPFSAPSIETIHVDDNAQIANLGRHAASGIVIAVWQRNDFAIRTSSGDIVNVSLADTPPPTCGDAVEAAGIPDTDLYRINLRRAIWRKKPGASRREPEKPEPTDAADIFTRNGHCEINPSLHGKAISLRGLVVAMPSAGANDETVRLQCGDFMVPVDVSATPKALDGVEIGSKAEMSGACIVKTDSWRPNEPLPRIREVVLVVRTPSDVKVLVPPPWWTPGRLFVLVATLVVIIAAFVLWNILLRRLADKRGRELMHTRLSQEESKLKVQERTRIAVELHDTIAQNLTGVSLELDSAEQLARKDIDGMMSHLGMAVRTLQSCRNELRNCLWDLRSRALEETDLNEAIRRTVAPLVSDVDLVIQFNAPRRAIADDTAHVLMRIIRELVQNAVRHGGASAVKIEGSLEGDALRFSVRDNGCGFDPETRPGVMQGHFGLQGIRERINKFNGEMEIESSPGEGAKVSISIRL